MQLLFAVEAYDYDHKENRIGRKVGLIKSHKSFS